MILYFVIDLSVAVNHLNVPADHMVEHYTTDWLFKQLANFLRFLVEYIPKFGTCGAWFGWWQADEEACCYSKQSVSTCVNKRYIKCGSDKVSTICLFSALSGMYVHCVCIFNCTHAQM